MISRIERCPAGMTLVEMLVALTATLLLMAAVAQAFSAFGSAISGSRAVLGLDGRMRNVAWRLRSDLAGVTARTLPPGAAAAGEGYFEIIEGPARDADAADGTAVGPADHDDVLLFTTRNTDTPFIGRAPVGGSTASLLKDTFESTIAEVAWFARATVPQTTPVTYTLYRRQMLVMGYIGTGTFSGDNATPWKGSWAAYFNSPCDVSVRRESLQLIPNALDDLTRPEFRFLHNVTGTYSMTGAGQFPFTFVSNHQAIPAPDGLIFDSTSARQGEDVVLTNVLSFDVRVFDPGAPVWMSSDGVTALAPGDGSPGTPVGAGAYVDLGHGITAKATIDGKTVTPLFGDYGAPKSQRRGSPTSRRTYDTWSNHYEANGRDEDASLGDTAGADQGTNGLDEDGNKLVDDAAELETSPPYPVPLRGIEIRIRCYEPSSRQVRQVTVRHTFVPH